MFGSRVRVDAVSKVAELEMAEKEKMKAKVERILKHDMNVFINRQVKVLRTKPALNRLILKYDVTNDMHDVSQLVLAYHCVCVTFCSQTVDLQLPRAAVR